ncbi:hypothetical protein L1999_13590 [Neobacillus drentensis]|uniref:hypothetical protein n=1 Tax=Neobacillus drentensis TaxID=220684 RepID=UPI001F24EC88|nr:hypothetical protein [Neobacillus drentensis]ULT59487.1 hypothetical protein L1999_13590 [Neobacillus drentensis]
MTLLFVGIGCIIVGFGLSSLSFYEVKDGLKFLFEERNKINKIAFFFTIFEYVTGIFMVGILLILLGIVIIVFTLF